MTHDIWNQTVRDSIKNHQERILVLEAEHESKILHVVPINIAVDTTTGVQYLPIPSELNTLILVRCQAFVITAGTTNATTIQIRNITRYSGNNTLSAVLSIASGQTVSTGGTIDADYDDVQTDDVLKIYVTANSTVKPLGLYVVLEFETA